ncbi:MAG: NTP transferase domain-containing protein [FCB group bacterium]|nr:NTP transferase domain-containing protein [FCB group bacterium]
MKVIIPAAGIGSRLRPHTHTIPKSLLHVAGKPILAHILDTVATLEPKEIRIVTGFLGEKVREYVSSNYDLNTTFVEQRELLGLGYAVHMALSEADSGPALIILGDTIVDTDLSAFLAEGDNVLGLMKVDDPSRFGIAEIGDGKISALEEKPVEPKSNLALIGLYYVSDCRRLYESLGKLVTSDRRTRGEIQLTDALQNMIEAGVKFAPYTVDGWFDCGKRETLISTNRHLLEKLAPPIKIEGSVVIPPSYVAPSAQIEASVIGPYVSISDKARIKNSVIRNSIIGFEAEVRNVILTDSLVGHRATVFGDFKELNVGDSSEIGSL